jgi:hypothetical protein
MVEHQRKVNAIVLKEPALDNMMSFAGAGFGSAGNTGGFFLHTLQTAARSIVPTRW